MSNQNFMYVPPMFTYKVGSKNMFVMDNMFFYLTDDEMTNMKKSGSSRDEIVTYVFEFLSKKRLADFSEMHNLFSERIQG